MRLLLDTHIALWAVEDNQRLSVRARDLIATTENEIFVSAATLWEIAIKHALRKRGRGAMPMSAEQARNYFAAAGYSFLAIEAQHACALEKLPRLHADPFDRILLAQAYVEPMRLLTQDTRMLAYGDAVIEA